MSNRKGNPKIEFLIGDNLERLREREDNSISSAVIDPPYGLGKEPDPVKVMTDWVASGYHEVSNKSGFMGKEWDAFVPQPITWKEHLRVLKPGALMLVACGTRTVDWMMMSLRFGGFKVKDVITWHYGSGFPKNMNISKSIDKKEGANRKIIGISPNWRESKRDREKNGSMEVRGKNAGIQFGPAITDEAKEWDGYGTALKPATEMFILVQKPISENTITENVLKWGTGAINIDGNLIGYESEEDLESAKWGRGTNILSGNYVGATHGNGKENIDANPDGRWPANVIFDEHTAEMLDKQTGILTSGAMKKPYQYTNNGYSLGKPTGETKQIHEASKGGASRFFYCAKPSKWERNFGLENIINHHPTVKPLNLIRHFVKLITPKGGICLDSYGGSGTTGIACKLEGFDCIIIEREEEYVPIIKQRIDAWTDEPEEMRKKSKKKAKKSNVNVDLDTLNQPELF